MSSVIQIVSGYAVVPAWGGPDNFVNVGGRAWTDQQGFCQDDGRRFRMRAARQVDFYVPLTNPVIFDDSSGPPMRPNPVRMRASFAAITLQLDPPAILTTFQVWDRTTSVFQSPPLAINGNYRRRWVEGENAFGLPFDAEVQGSLAIKISILAIGEGDVIFTGAAIKFHT